MEEKFKLGSKALEKELESKYFKFTLGIPQNIEVVEDQDLEKTIKEFTDKDGIIKLSTKYELDIIVGAEKKIWSVSKKVLTTINDHIKNTQKFKIILRDTSYEVIPLGLKE